MLLANISISMINNMLKVLRSPHSKETGSNSLNLMFPTLFDHRALLLPLYLQSEILTFSEC